MSSLAGGMAWLLTPLCRKSLLACALLPSSLRSVAIELAHERNPANHLRSWRKWWLKLVDVLCYPELPRQCFTVFVNPEAATLDKVIPILYPYHRSMIVERLAVCPLPETRFSARMKSWPMF
jgi:hypothetical protein